MFDLFVVARAQNHANTLLLWCERSWYFFLLLLFLCLCGGSAACQFQWIYLISSINNRAIRVIHYRRLRPEYWLFFFNLEFHSTIRMPTFLLVLTLPPSLPHFSLTPRKTTRIHMTRVMRLLVFFSSNRLLWIFRCNDLPDKNHALLVIKSFDSEKNNRKLFKKKKNNSRWRVINEHIYAHVYSYKK